MEPTTVLFAVFFFALGSCIGSFLNVVIWRLPYKMVGTEVTFQGKTGRLTLSWPPSHCPHCDSAIPWYLNIPMLGWLIIAGQCARCRAPIAVRYPLVELATGLLFLATYLAYFVGNLHPQASAIVPDFARDWPVLLLHLLFIAALLAAAAIDADSYMIPLSIPAVVVAVAVAASPLIPSPLIPHLATDTQWHMANPTLGAAIGLIIANVLVFTRVLPMSFAAPAEPTPPASGATPPPSAGDQEKIRPLPNLTRKLPVVLLTIALLTLAAAAWIVLPGRWASLATVVAGTLLFIVAILGRDADSHDVTDEVMAEISAPGARREMLKEVLFLTFPVAGAIIAAMLPDLPRHEWLARLLAVILGLIVGGGSIWFVRILGTFWKGIEAMGLGDVHLMAAAGAVLGPWLVLMAFPIFAPVLALTWAAIRYLAHRHTILPFGPWLALASILTLFVGQPVLEWYLKYLAQ